MTDLLARLQPIFQDVLDNPALVISPESNAQNVYGWDSLAHINLVASIEGEFRIRFGLGELEGLKNVGDMVRLIEAKLAKA